MDDMTYNNNVSDINHTTAENKSADGNHMTDNNNAAGINHMTGKDAMYKGRFALDKQGKYTFQELTDIIAALRAPDGCPWDREQTFETMKKYLVSEAQEVLEAVDRQDTDNLCEELGDVLLEILLFSQIAKEQEQFDISDVIDTISRKMIRRHPHVFAGVKVSSETEQKALWEEIKQQEKAMKKSDISANPVKNS